MVRKCLKIIYINKLISHHDGIFSPIGSQYAATMHYYLIMQFGHYPGMVGRPQLRGVGRFISLPGTYQA